MDSDPKSQSVQKTYWYQIQHKVDVYYYNQNTFPKKQVSPFYKTRFVNAKRLTHSIKHKVLTFVDKSQKEIKCYHIRGHVLLVMNSPLL